MIRHKRTEISQHMISGWQGYEAAVIEFLFVNYMIGRKKKK